MALDFDPVAITFPSKTVVPGMPTTLFTRTSPLATAKEPTTAFLAHASTDQICKPTNSNAEITNTPVRWLRMLIPPGLDHFPWEPGAATQ